MLVAATTFSVAALAEAALEGQDQSHSQAGRVGQEGQAGLDRNQSQEGQEGQAGHAN